VGSSYSQTLAATGGSGTYTWSITSGSLPSGLSLASSTGAITGTPTTAGTSNVTFKVADGIGTVSKALSITINPSTLAITTSSLAAGNVGVTYSQTLGASGGTSPYTWTLSSGSLPAGLSLNSSTGVISGTPTGAGTTSATYLVTDSASVTANKTISITINTVNNAPVATLDSYTTNTNTVLSVAAPGVLSNDTDANGDTLTAALVSNVSHGTLNLNSNGSFTFTPTTGYVGTDSFTYKANDGKADSNTVTVTITISAPANTAPVAVNDSYSAIGNTALTVSAAGVLSNDTDANGDALTAALVSNVSHGTLNLNTNGSFTFTPTTGYTGTDSFTYKANDSKADSNTATVTITISAPANTAPVATNDAYSMTGNTALTVAAPGVLSNDTDANGDTLTAALVSSVSHGTLSLNANGSFTFTPTTGYTGTDSFTYKANDGKADSNTATVTITINAPADTAPVANNYSYSVVQGEVLTVNNPGILANSSSGGSGTLSAILVTTVSHCSLTLNADGSFAYNSSANYTGLDNFTYKVSDGTLESNIGTVTITVTVKTTIDPVLAKFGLSAGSKTYQEYGNAIDFQRFQNTAGTGKLTKLELLINDTTPHGKVRLGVYADVNGKPGALLLDAGEVIVTNGWVSISGLNLPVTKNTYYWLAFTMQSQNGVTYIISPTARSHYYIWAKYGALQAKYNPGYYALANSIQYVMRATVVLSN
jgi:VCBS repeat-containing protein